MTAPLPPYIVSQLALIEAKAKELNAEQIRRGNIEFSEEYISLNRQIDMLNLRKAEMVADLQDEKMQRELDGLKTALFAVMKREGREVVGNWKGKFKEHKGVNCDKLLHVLHGDLDRFLRMANVTQVQLKSFAKAEGGDRESALLDCIEVTERELVDLVPIEAQR